jgi:DNA-binding transcriptional regulator YiaG
MGPHMGPHMGPLHRAIAQIAQAIAVKPARLVPNEVRFIRDHLALSNKDFAELMGVSAEQASRWMTEHPSGVPAERFLRMLATLGPDAVKASSDPVDDRLEALASFKAIDIVRTMGHLPPPSTPARNVQIGLRRNGAAGWKPDLTLSN